MLGGLSSPLLRAVDKRRLCACLIQIGHLKEIERSWARRRQLGARAHPPQSLLVFISEEPGKLVLFFHSAHQQVAIPWIYLSLISDLRLPSH